MIIEVRRSKIQVLRVVDKLIGDRLEVKRKNGITPNGHGESNGHRVVFRNASHLCVSKHDNQIRVQRKCGQSQDLWFIVKSQAFKRPDVMGVSAKMLQTSGGGRGQQDDSKYIGNAGSEMLS
ncbi:hypothetical protein TNCV_2143581 [Trichonephila clavipes]|nr:hypothetical protein TNCV_2143581 [Trichonephila clavipes]